MKKEYVVGLVAIGVLILFVVVLLAQGPAIGSENGSNRNVKEIPTKNIDSAISSECMVKLAAKNLKPNIDYGAGRVIVGFKDGATITNAKDILAKYSLESNINLYETKPDMYIWSQTPFLVVSVQAGKEFEWICRLQADIDIKYAELDSIGHVA